MTLLHQQIRSLPCTALHALSRLRMQRPCKASWLALHRQPAIFAVRHVLHLQLGKSLACCVDQAQDAVLSKLTAVSGSSNASCHTAPVKALCHRLCYYCGTLVGILMRFCRVSVSGGSSQQVHLIKSVLLCRCGMFISRSCRGSRSERS